MQSYTVSKNLDLTVLMKSQINKIQKNIHTKMREKINEAMEYTRSKIAEYAPNDTGDMRNKILSIPLHITKERGFDLITGRDGIFRVTLSLAGRKFQKILWVNNGTGIYGPHGTPIVPKRSEFLIFNIGSRWFKMRSVKGQKPQRFIEKGINVSKIIIKGKIRSAVKEL
jgi:hypothetical protein